MCSDNDDGSLILKDYVAVRWKRTIGIVTYLIRPFSCVRPLPPVARMVRCTGKMNDTTWRRGGTREGGELRPLYSQKPPRHYVRLRLSHLFPPTRGVLLTLPQFHRRLLYSKKEKVLLYMFPFSHFQRPRARLIFYLYIIFSYRIIH
jgi:hypothetical protein